MLTFSAQCGSMSNGDIVLVLPLNISQSQSKKKNKQLAHLCLSFNLFVFFPSLPFCKNQMGWEARSNTGGIFSSLGFIFHSGCEQSQRL